MPLQVQVVFYRFKKKYIYRVYLILLSKYVAGAGSLCSVAY